MMDRPILTSAILVDIDGTLANNSHRILLVKNPDGSTRRDWQTYRSLAMEDAPFRWCVETIKVFRAAGYAILFVTGRDASERWLTLEWLRRHVPFAADPEFRLYMRGDEDQREDFEIKREIFYREIWDKFDVVMALEDRTQVVQMYREIGVICLQCWDNDD